MGFKKTEFVTCIGLIWLRNGTIRRTPFIRNYYENPGYIEGQGISDKHPVISHHQLFQKHSDTVS